MKLAEALKLASDGAKGAVWIDEPWVSKSAGSWLSAGHSMIVGPGSVDLDYLREHAETAREWTPADAR